MNARRSMLARLTLPIIALMLAVWFLGPAYWALNTSLQPAASISATPADYLPLPPSTQSYATVLADRMFLRSVVNSAVVAGGATLLALALGSLAGCALGRYRFRGRGAIMALFLSLTMFPQISVLGAIFSMVTAAGLFNTHAALIFAYMLTAMPLTIWLLSTFFRELPRDLEEAAFVDGATPFQTFVRVLLPLAAPGLVTAGLLTFIATWNEYLFALSLTLDGRARTAPVAIAQFTGASTYEIPWGEIMAASVLVTAPLVVLVLVFEKRIVAGLTTGAVKG